MANFYASAYPVQIQADNENAKDGMVPCMCHVFDERGAVCMYQALERQYLHVVAWDASGTLVHEYDNRR